MKVGWVETKMMKWIQGKWIQYLGLNYPQCCRWVQRTWVVSRWVKEGSHDSEVLIEEIKFTFPYTAKQILVWNWDWLGRGCMKETWISFVMCQICKDGVLWADGNRSISSGESPEASKCSKWDAWCGPAKAEQKHPPCRNRDREKEA